METIRDRKKLAERQIVGLLETNVSDFPVGRIQPNEEPDFLIAGPHAMTGIEVTDVLPSGRGRGSVLRHIDAEVRGVLTTAHDICKDRGCPACVVGITVTHSPNFKKRHRAELAEWLADFIITNCPEQGRERSFDARPSRNHPLADGFTRISVSRHPEMTSVQLLPIRAGAVTQDFASLLQGIVDQKSQALPRYRDKCDDCWLALAVRRPDFMDPSPKTVGHRYHSLFNRTYLVDLTSRKVWLLDTGT